MNKGKGERLKVNGEGKTVWVNVLTLTLILKPFPSADRDVS